MGVYVRDVILGQVYLLNFAPISYIWRNYTAKMLLQFFYSYPTTSKGLHD
jgi:hypothetical protein